MHGANDAGKSGKLFCIILIVVKSPQFEIAFDTKLFKPTFCIENDWSLENMLKTPVGTYNNLDGDWKFKLNVELSTKFEGFPATVICSVADVTSVMLTTLQLPEV